MLRATFVAGGGQNGAGAGWGPWVGILDGVPHEGEIELDDLWGSFAVAVLERRSGR